MSKSQKNNLPTRTDSSNIEDDIREILDRIQFGDASFQIKRNNGNNHQLIVSYYDHVRYSDNTESASAILQTLVRLSEKKFNGAYTFTVNYKDGTIKEVIYEGLEQIKYG